MKIRNPLPLLIVLATLAGTAFAADDKPPTGQPPGPPPEAVAACKGKTEGTSVSFTGHRGETMTGVCQLSNGVLAARPSGQPPGGQRPPAQK